MTDDRARSGLPSAVTGVVVVLSLAPLVVLALRPSFAQARSLESAVVLHTLLEWSAVCLSLAAATLACLYYRVRAHVLVLTIGLAGLLSGAWDVVHTFASASLIPLSPELDRVIPMTWAASRTVRAAILLGGAGLALTVARGRRPSSRTAGRVICGAGFLVTVAAGLGLYFGWDAFSEPLKPESTIRRPWDVPALVLFALGGLVVLPLAQRRQPTLLGHVLILSAVPEIVTQLQLTFFSQSLYDEAFVLAHLTKVIACAVPSTGILLELTRAYRREVTGRGRMEAMVDELRMTAEELRVKEAHLDQLTEGIREVFWISEPDGSRMHYVSPLYEEVFGLPVASLYEEPQSFLEAVHPDDREVMRDLNETYVADQFEIDYRIVRKDGTTRWLRTRGFPVRDEAGRVYRLAGITEDVTEHKLAEEAVRVSEARMRALFSAVPDLVVRANEKGLVLDFHGQLAAGFSDVMGKQLREVLPAPPHRLSETLEATLTSSRLDVQVLEYRAEASGRVGDFEARFVRSAVDEVLVLVRDLTDQKVLEREILEVSRREQERIGSDLHDGIAQSLTGIALLSQVLHRDLQAARRPESEKAGRIARLVEETLAQTRTLARGLAPVELDERGFSAALEEMASGVEAVHSVRCLCQCDERALVRDHDKATHLFRIAQEAVNNAIRHADASSIEISLRRRNGRFVMSIKDDGIGIEQGRVAGAGSGGGGMGLHIMRYRARMIDASIELRSAAKTGTVVTCQWTASD